MKSHINKIMKKLHNDQWEDWSEWHAFKCKFQGHFCRNPILRRVRMRLTLPKWELGSPSGLPKLQSSIAGVKTTRHLDIWSTSYGQKKNQESNWQFDSRPPKVGNRPDPEAFRWSATRHWKALNESYKFVSNLIPIGGLGKELWFRKVVGVQTGIVSGLLLGSPGIKSHLDVGVVERRREYYMREGGGFPRIWTVVSFVSPESPMACPSTKGAPESELTNLLVSWMQIWVSNQKLVTLPSPILELQHAPSTPPL